MIIIIVVVFERETERESLVREIGEREKKEKDEEMRKIDTGLLDIKTSEQLHSALQ